MSTMKEHLDSLARRREEIYARCELFDGVNHLELEVDRQFAFEAKLFVAVHLDELLALAESRENASSVCADAQPPVQSDEQL